MKAFLKKILFKIQITAFKKIINSKNAWLIFDRSGLPGFGINLSRTYFPIYYDKKENRNSFSEELIKQFTDCIEKQKTEALEHLIVTEIPQLLQLSKEEKIVKLPYLDNYFFGIHDAAALSALMQHFKPKKLIEIGSGISTRYMNFFKDKYALETKITCIDPSPRVEIDAVCQQLINLPLELALEQNFFQLESGDFLFMDGSHYVFQGNDTLSFFFKLLPSLPSGVIIHIHDVYLPYDYAMNVSSQLWTEQYLLAAIMMNGFNEYEVLYAAYYESIHNPKIKQVLEKTDEALRNQNFEKRKSHTEGYSFWMRKK
ncbi:class I SAM-dependent methyltransferase [Pedobacter sp. MW01-1-1]|uniref:class I SAM-dependent methyltransferase n=1 Tax=Pedobacter sp. MW01-1-1 TaxID=3383027 RepID=UPI003FEF32DE